MKKFIIGNKVGMTELILENGDVVPVTVIESFKNQILRIKSVESDGYSSIVLGYDSAKSAESLTRPDAGQFKGQDAFKKICEFRVEDTSAYTVGSSIDLSQFSEDEEVDVRGKSKGRGFTGTIRRWNFNRGPMSHGSKSHRIPGSIGGGTTPGRVVKGKKMPGHYGNTFVTALKLVVVKLDLERGLLYVRGAVPGSNGSEVRVVAG